MGVYLQQTDGSLKPEELYAIPYASHYNPQGLDLRDINADLSPDAVIADSNNGLVVLSSATTTGSAEVFFDDLEAGLGNWILEGSDGVGGPALWTHTQHRFSSAGSALYYGKLDTLDYNTGKRNFGSATTMPIDLTTMSDAHLSFSHFLRKESSQYYDIARVQVSTDEGASWQDVYVVTQSTAGDEMQRIDVSLAAYIGQMIRLRFSFDTRDALYNDYEGWVIDDVLIEAERP